MSKPEKQHVDALDAHNGEHAGADVTRGSGPDAQLATQTKGEAGGSQSPQPSSTGDRRPPEGALTIPHSFALLRDCVASMERRGSSTAAAGVAASMIKVDARFNPRATPFGTFRRFLEAAAGQGVVLLSSSPGGSDLVVTLPAGASVSATDVPPPAHRWLRPDLWRAFVAGNSEGLYAFDRRNHLTHYWPEGIPAGSDADQVPVLPISTAQQLEWMRDFTERERDAEVREALEVALRDPKAPDKSFRAAVRDRESLSRRWGRHFRALVMSAAEDWARLNGLELAAIIRDSRTPGHGDQLGKTAPAAGASGAHLAPSSERATASKADNLVDDVLRFSGSWATGADRAMDDSELRIRLLKAIASMPLGELLRLPIPAEYLLRR